MLHLTSSIVVCIPRILDDFGVFLQEEPVDRCFIQMIATTVNVPSPGSLGKSFNEWPSGSISLLEKLVSESQ